MKNHLTHKIEPNQHELNRLTHELRTPNEAFFNWNPKLLGLGWQFGQINFGAFGVFSADLSAPILVPWVPCPCFSLINHYFYKKLSLYIQIPNIYLGLLELGFEFGPGIYQWSIILADTDFFQQKTKPLYPNPKYLFGIRIWTRAAKN